MRALGANVTVVDGGPDVVHGAARDLADRESGCRLVSDGEPAAVAEGHGTIGIELLRTGTLERCTYAIEATKKAICWPFCEAL